MFLLHVVGPIMNGATAKAVLPYKTDNLGTKSDGPPAYAVFSHLSTVFTLGVCMMERRLCPQVPQSPARTRANESAFKKRQE